MRSIMSESTRSRNSRELVEEWLRARRFLGSSGGMRMDQVETEPAEEELAHEARSGPFALARRFGDVAGFVLGGDVGRVGHDS